MSNKEIHSFYNVRVEENKHLANLIYRRIGHNASLACPKLDQLATYEFLYSTDVCHKKNYNEIILQVNLEQITQLLEHGQHIPGHQAIVEILRESLVDIENHPRHKQTIIQNALKPVSYPIMDYVSVNSSELNKSDELKYLLFNLFKAKAKLFSFQIENIMWMFERESNNAKFNFYDPKWFVYEPLNLSINLKTGRIYSQLPPCEQIQLKGGCLIDDINLGKTICGVGLCLLDKVVNLSKEGTCGKDKIFNITMDGMSVPRYVNTNCSLVITTKKSIGKWKSELEKKLPLGKLTVLTITSRAGLEDLAYSDIKNYDMILLNAELIFSKHYRQVFSTYEKITYHNYEMGTSENYHNLIHSYCTQIMNHQNLHDMTVDSGLVLQLFKWRRVILDDVHEYLNSKLRTHYLDNLASIDCHTRWCFTGVPFLKNYQNYIDYMALTTSANSVSGCGNSGNSSPHLCLSLNLKLAETLFRRNSRQSIRDEYTFPEIHEKVIYLPMDPVQSILYDNLGVFYPGEITQARSKFCSNLFLLDEVGTIAHNTYTYKQLKKTLLKRNQDLLKKYQFNCKLLSNKIENKRSKLKYFKEKNRVDRSADKTIENSEGAESISMESSSTIQEIYHTLESSIVQSQKELENLKDEMSNLDNHTYIENLDTDAECTICSNERQCVLTCGHSVCLSCIINYYQFDEVFKCPVCRRSLYLDDIFTIGAPTAYLRKCREIFKLIKKVHKEYKEDSSESDMLDLEGEENNENNEEDSSKYKYNILLVTEHESNHKLVRDVLRFNNKDRLNIEITNYDVVIPRVGSDEEKGASISTGNRLPDETSEMSDELSDELPDELSDESNTRKRKKLKVEHQKEFVKYEFTFTNHINFQKILNNKTFDAIIFMDLPLEQTLTSSNNNFLDKYHRVGDESVGMKIYYLLYKGTVEEQLWLHSS